MRNLNSYFKIIGLAVICVVLHCSLFHLAFSEISEVKWDNISDKDISPKGRAALAFENIIWKHAETEHFVYHFTDDKQAETIYVHAEVYYKWIKNLFGVTKDTWAKKNHIFIFSDKKAWQGFRDRIGKGSKATAFTDGWELFIYREPHYLEVREDLAHEITHVIVFRFLEGPIPLYLNEGLAEFMSIRAIAAQLGRMEYDLRPVELVSETDFIPLQDLAIMDDYPKEKTKVFYNESGLFVRFLIFTYKGEQFYEFLRIISKGSDFKKAITQVYRIDIEEFQGQFKKYALKK